ncbi:LytR C-terminal domain-containing protein [Streptomyces sp. NPDC051104]|uniref:LytR C-terminal domain-containing protein n=1 Tax=Streptomyces sp. NPDC051104 TaxID=3155044 RepID=UPI0034384304
MSMLTPPGMGGQYRITGGKYPRMRPPRRRGRLVVAIVASVAAIGLIGWGTLQLIDVFTGGSGRTSASGPKAGCAGKVSASPAAAHALPEPGRITVNVLNATERSGLAKETADELKKRGFHIGTVGNATQQYDKKVKGVGILLGPKASLHSALPVLATQLAGAAQRTDARTDASVDLVLGDDFKSLTAKPDADKALAALTNPTPTASPGSTGKRSC